MQRHTDFILLIDESLKIHDREFFDHCIDLAKEAHFRILHERAEDLKIPVLIIGSETFLNEMQGDQKYDILILFRIENLNLFSASAQKCESLEFDNFQQLKASWPLILNILCSELINLEQNILSSHKNHILFLLKKSINFENAYLYEDFEKDLLSLSLHEFRLEDVNALLFKFFKNEFSLCTLNDFRLNEKKYFLPIPYKNGQTIFLISSHEFLDLYIYKLIYEFYLRELSWMDYEKKLDEISELKNFIPEPILILNSKGDALIYNNAFTKLNFSLKLCSELKNGEQIEIQEVTFKIVIQDRENGDKAYFFFPIDAYLNLGNQPTTQELGIISSSLAHELNNPLGGILAAINVLELDISDSEITTQLAEMKQGVLRCKNLVEMFLGFSRLDSQAPFRHDIKLKQIIEQSFDLIRFRMVECNMNFNFQYSYRSAFQLIGNPYVLSMVFYLLWSELITAYSRQKLVGLELGDNLHIRIEENKKDIIIKFIDEILIDDQFFKSKLLVHLCELGRIKIINSKGIINLEADSVINALLEN